MSSVLSSTSCFSSSGAHRGLPSFPTRRSSDLAPLADVLMQNAALPIDCGPCMLLPLVDGELVLDRKSTRLNSSHVEISYAVFCLKKKTARCDRLRRVMGLGLPDLPGDGPVRSA